jgi:hypothetical protein
MWRRVEKQDLRTRAVDFTARWRRPISIEPAVTMARLYRCLSRAVVVASRGPTLGGPVAAREVHDARTDRDPGQEGR